MNDIAIVVQIHLRRNWLLVLLFLQQNPPSSTTTRIIPKRRDPSETKMTMTWWHKSLVIILPRKKRKTVILFCSWRIGSANGMVAFGREIPNTNTSYHPTNCNKRNWLAGTPVDCTVLYWSFDILWLIPQRAKNVRGGNVGNRDGCHTRFTIVFIKAGKGKRLMIVWVIF